MKKLYKLLCFWSGKLSRNERKRCRYHYQSSTIFFMFAREKRDIEKIDHGTVFIYKVNNFVFWSMVYIAF